MILRFRKYLKMYFTNDGKIIGAKVFDYLLEKSRVVQHGVGEKNYHMFYYLFHGLKNTKFFFGNNIKIAYVYCV